MSRFPFAVLLLVVLLGCSAGGSSFQGGDIGRTQSHDDLHIMLSAQGVKILGASPATGAKSASIHGQLRYEFRTTRGDLRATGRINDPRVLRSEYVTNNGYGQIDVRADQGLATLRLPSIEGDLILVGPTSQGVREIGRVHYKPASTGRSTDALLDDSKDILDKPVKLPGGDGSGKKLNILILPEGFQESEMDAFHANVDKVVKAFKEVKAYAPYLDRIQIWRQDVRSNESGVDKPLSQVSRDTAFDISYGDNADLERCTWFKSDTALQTASALGKAVDAHVVVVVANDTGWGGCASGGFVVQTLSSDAGAVLAHEIGHAIFGLADEYDYGTCDAGAQGPNISASPKLESLPWKDLVNTDELPTAETEDKSSLIGAFEGAAYCTSGLYRPQLHCIMGEIGQPFCRACAREIDRWFGAAGSGKSDDPGADPGSGTGGSAGAGSGCGSVTYEGKCTGAQLSWCESSELKTLDCSAQGGECAWDSTNNYYNCAAASGGAAGSSTGGSGGSGEPSNGGSGGSGASGGSGSAGCGSVTWEGSCQGNVLTWCENGEIKLSDCSASSAQCEWNAASGFYDCVASGAGGGSTGGSGGSSGSGAGGSGGSTSECGTITSVGECSGDTLSYCSNGSLVTVECSVQGQTCGYDPQNAYYDCLASSGGTGGSGGSTGSCGGVTVEGECSGTVLSYCSNGSLVTVDCADSGKTCDWNSAASYYDCL